MKGFWNAMKANSALGAIFLAGVFGFAFLPPKSFKDVTQELIALFGLMMAGVLPTMVLTASVLRPGNLSVKKLIEYRDALRVQLTIWIGLFLVSLAASLLVIVGKMLDWSIIIRIPSEWAGAPTKSFELIYALNALIAMSLILIVLRTTAVGSGVISLLRLSADLAISEAQARDDARHREATRSIADMSERRGFGEYIALE